MIDLDIWDILGEVYGGSTKTETKERLLRYVWGQMRIHGERRPPLIKMPQKSDFIRSRKTKIVYRSMDKIDGYLDISGNEILVSVKESLRNKPLLLRTVIAHELGHTFLLNIESKPIKPYYPISWSTQKRWQQIEGLAFEIGRQILVPDALAKRYLHSSPSLNSFDHLKSVFRVTTPIMARRLIHDLELWDAYLFVSEFDSKFFCFKIPSYKNRHKAKESFRSFSLNKHWNRVQFLLTEKLKKRMNEPIFAKFGRNFYKIEMEILRDPRWALCLLVPVGTTKHSHKIENARTRSPPRSRLK